MYGFFVDYNIIDTSYIVEIHKYLMKKHVMFAFIKQTNIVLVLVMLDVGGSLATKSSISINNQPCMTRPAFEDLNADKLHYYSFNTSLDICDGSCNADEDSCGIICLPNKIEDINLKVFNMRKEINESKTLVLMQIRI